MSTLRNLSVFSLTFTVYGLVCAVGSADTVIHKFSGNIVEASVNASGTSVGGISVGDAFTATLRYDTPGADLIPLDTTVGAYWDAGWLATFTVGPQTFTIEAMVYVYNDDFGYDAFRQWNSALLTMPPGWSGSYGGFIQLEDSSATAFSSESLPLALNPGAFDYHNIGIGVSSANGDETFPDGRLYSGDNLVIRGTVDSISTTIIPLPATLWLGFCMFTGMAVVGGWRKWKRAA